MPSFPFFAVKAGAYTLMTERAAETRPDSGMSNLKLAVDVKVESIRLDLRKGQLVRNRLRLPAEHPIVIRPEAFPVDFYGLFKLRIIKCSAPYSLREADRIECLAPVQISPRSAQAQISWMLHSK